MTKKKKAERLSTEEVLAFVPESFRDGARVIYNPDQDEYLVYYILNINYEVEDPRDCVSRLLVGFVHQGQWVVCRSYELLMEQAQKRQAQHDAELKAQLAAAKEEEQALIKELEANKQAIADAKQEQEKLKEQQAQLKERIAQLQEQLGVQSNAPDQAQSDAQPDAQPDAQDNVSDNAEDEPQTQHQIIAGEAYEITKL